MSFTRLLGKMGQNMGLKWFVLQLTGLKLRNNQVMCALKATHLLDLVKFAYIESVVTIIYTFHTE